MTKRTKAAQSSKKKHLTIKSANNLINIKNTQHTNRFDLQRSYPHCEWAKQELMPYLDHLIVANAIPASEEVGDMLRYLLKPDQTSVRAIGLMKQGAYFKVYDREFYHDFLDKVFKINSRDKGIELREKALAAAHPEDRDAVSRTYKYFAPTKKANTPSNTANKLLYNMAEPDYNRDEIINESEQITPTDSLENLYSTAYLSCLLPPVPPKKISIGSFSIFSHQQGLISILNSQEENKKLDEDLQDYMRDTNRL